MIRLWLISLFKALIRIAAGSGEDLLNNFRTGLICGVGIALSVIALAAPPTLSYEYRGDLLMAGVLLPLLALAIVLLQTVRTGKADPLVRLADIISGPDRLTGLASRRGFMLALRRFQVEHARKAIPFSIAYIRIANLEAIERRHGVKAADRALAHVAQAVVGSCRMTDVVGLVRRGDVAVALSGADHDRVQAYLGRLVPDLQVVPSRRKTDEEATPGPATAPRGPIVITLALGIVPWHCDDQASATQLLEAAEARLGNARQVLNAPSTIWDQEAQPVDGGTHTSIV